MKVDIAVVGGGVIGLMCAWRLRQRGCAVTLFERGQAGRESSWAAAGMLAPLCEAARHPPSSEDKSAAETFLQFGIRSRALYLELARELLESTGIDIELSIMGAPTPDWRTPGFRYYATTPDDPAMAGFRELREQGHSIREVEAQGIDAGACFELPEEGQVENRILVQALKTAAAKSGVEIRESATVEGITTKGDRISGLTIGGEQVECKRVLICAGAWSGTIEGLDLPIRPKRGQMIALRGDRTLRQVAYSSNVYIVPRRDGRILVGATMEEVGYDKSTTTEARDKLLANAYRLLPDLRDFPVECHWAGLRPATPDGLPILGPTSVENLYVAAGHYRNGILLTPATGDLITAYVLDHGSIPNPFHFARLAACAK